MVGHHCHLHHQRISFPRKALHRINACFVGVLRDFADHLQILSILHSHLAYYFHLLPLTWAFGTLYTKNHAKKFNPYFSLGFQMLIAGIALYGISMLQPNYVPIQNLPIQAWYSIGYLILFGSIIGFGSFLYTLEHLPINRPPFVCIY